MAEQRPNPDELLSHVQAEEARANRGRLRIFFGATAGVGKTYSMLEAALGKRAIGTDVVSELERLCLEVAATHLSVTFFAGQLVFRRPSEVEIKEAARAQGQITMRQDGILKVLAGITDLLEVERVVGVG